MPVNQVTSPMPEFELFHQRTSKAVKDAKHRYVRRREKESRKKKKKEKIASPTHHE
jgi:hypothetical protein